MELQTKFHEHKNIFFYSCLILLFSSLSISLILHHEPSRDESQAWLFGGDYSVTSFLLTREIYESSAPIEMMHLVPSLLFHLGLPYASLPFTVFLTMLISIILFLFYAPFSKVQKTLFIFGYFIFYEYTIIARSYTFSVLFLFCLAILYKDRFKRPYLYTLFLFLLGLTHFYVLGIATILMCVYYFELFFQFFQNRRIEQIGASKPFTRAHLFCFIISIFAFLYLFYPLIYQNNVSTEFTTWNTDLSIHHLGTIPTAVADAFLPIPKLTLHFWNSRGISRALFGLPIFLLTLLFFVKKIQPLLLYVAFCSSLFAAFFFRHAGAFRHHGLLFIIFIFCLWISREYKENEKIRVNVGEQMLNFLLILFLSIQVMATPIAFYYEWQYDFSSGQRAAFFLKENGLLNNTTFIASFPSGLTTDIQIYAPKYSLFYFIEYKDFRSFMTPNKQLELFYYHLPTLSNITKIIDNATEDKGYLSVLFITKWKIEPTEENSDKYTLLASYEENIINEPIFIYNKTG